MSGIDLTRTFSKLGWRIKWVRHEVISDYNACYNVNYQGRRIAPTAADILGIPPDEVWISEKFRKYATYILFHELQEIRYRAAGFNGDEAHSKAVDDEIQAWGSDPEWNDMNKTIGVGREQLVR